MGKKKRIVLISCVSQKRDHAAKAQDLYISTLFKLNLRYAESLKPDNIFILSAKYGLLPLEKRIDPYEQTLNNMGTKEIREWGEQVMKQIREVCTVEETEFIFLAGEKYRKFLIPNMPLAHVPLKGLRIGEQLQKLKELTDDR